MDNKAVSGVDVNVNVDINTLVSTYERIPTALASLRSHAYAVTSVAFSPCIDPVPSLVSADEGGWVFWWSLINRRPLAIWKPHEKSVTKVEFIFQNEDRRLLLTHGRDNKIKIFRMDIDPAALTTTAYVTDLPTQTSDPQHYKSPWMIHSQDVNSLNFCGAAVYGDCIAIPNTLSSEKIDIYGLWPEFRRLYFAIDPEDYTVSSSAVVSNLRQHGIVMAVVLTANKLVAAYESGEVFIYQVSLQNDPSNNKENASVELISCTKVHSQPVLSICLDENSGTFISTSADAMIVKHELATGKIIDQVNTKHPGLTSVAIRSDGLIFATAGWDGYIRVFEYVTMGVLSSFRAGRQQGVTCVSFAQIKQDDSSLTTRSTSVALSRQLVKAKSLHWIAIGGKDGRIALYDMY